LTKEIREEIKKFLESNGNENTTYQNLWDTARAMLGENFIDICAYIKKKETSQINNLVIYLKLLGKIITKPKTSRWRQIIKMRAKISKIKTKKKPNCTKN
jgi:hypothetical protein